MAIFKVGSVDFSKNVIVGTYEVNREDVYTAWTDGNSIEHRDIYRQKVRGSFDMEFRDLNDFRTFKEALALVRNIGGYYPLTVAINNTLEDDVAVNAYVSFNPKRTRFLQQFKDRFDVFTVNIEER